MHDKLCYKAGCFYDECFTQASRQSVEYFSFIYFHQQSKQKQGNKGHTIILSKHPEILGAILADLVLSRAKFPGYEVI